MLYRFSRWWLLQHNFTSGFTTGDFALFRMSVVMSKPYSVIITQSAAEITISDFEKQTSAILEFYFRFWFRPYHYNWHVILHQFAKFLSKSDRPQQKNDVMRICKMADLRHLGFEGSNNGFLEKPAYDFL